MRKFYFFFAAILTFASYAQCPPGSVIITNQSQIDNFIINYPNCTQITGDLIIDEVNITNLQGFSNITTITGAVEIREVNALANLNGLENLTTVGTDFILREVGDLQDIEALTSLTSVGGEFTFRSCPELVSLDGLENVTSVGLGLIIRDCESLISIEGLAGVTYIGEILEVVQCPLLTSLAGLENIETIIGGEEGALVIEGNDSLSSLDGLGSYSTVILGSVTISANQDLSYCSVPALCMYLQDVPEGATATIGLNITGCNTAAEVTAACEPLPVPSITTFTPDTICAGGEITITGTGFAAIESITVGGIPVVSYEVVSNTQIIAKVGPLSFGAIEITNVSGSVISTGEIALSTDFIAPPSGNGMQVIEVHNTAEATLADISTTLLEGGTITWYASEDDALAWQNPLQPEQILENGATYYATQTVGSCTSVNHFAVTVAIALGKNNFKLDKLSCYPVPVQDMLNITYASAINTVTVVNMLGQQVISLQPHTTGISIDISLLSAGIYLVNITSGVGSATIKIVKDR